jgi:hypothetical protein
MIKKTRLRVSRDCTSSFVIAVCFKGTPHPSRFPRLPAGRLIGSPKGASSKARQFGFRPIGYADLSGRLPKGVGQEAFWGARQSRADRAARAVRPIKKASLEAAGHY